MTRRRIAIVIRVLGVFVLVGGILTAAAVGWLIAGNPQPREAPGWKQAGYLPAARGELTTAVAQRGPGCAGGACDAAPRLFAIGGIAGLGRTEAAVTIYDPELDVWEHGPPLPEARHHTAAAGLHGAVYVAGGAADVLRWQGQTDTWRLAAGADDWNAVAPMPEPRWGHRLVAVDGRLYAVGGRGPSARVLRYDPAADRWSKKAALPAQRDHLAAVVVNGEIWAMGGRDHDGRVTDRVDIYHPDTDSWRDGPSLPAPTSGAAEGVLDGWIYIFGGEDPDLRTGAVFDRHWRLRAGHPEAEWEQARAPMLAVHGTEGAAIDGRLYITGGASRQGNLSLISWTRLTQVLAEP